MTHPESTLYLCCSAQLSFFGIFSHINVLVPYTRTDINGMEWFSDSIHAALQQTIPGKLVFALRLSLYQALS